MNNCLFDIDITFREKREKWRLRSVGVILCELINMFYLGSDSLLWKKKDIGKSAFDNASSVYLQCF